MTAFKLAQDIQILFWNLEEHLRLYYGYSNISTDTKVDYETAFKVKMHFKSKEVRIINYNGIDVTVPIVFYIIKNSVISTIELVRISPRQVLFIQDNKRKFDSCNKFIKTIHSHILPERFHKLIKNHYD